MAFNLGMTVYLFMTYMIMHARVDDLNLDAMPHWLGRWNHSALNYLDN